MLVGTSTVRPAESVNSLVCACPDCCPDYEDPPHAASAPAIPTANTSVHASARMRRDHALFGRALSILLPFYRPISCTGTQTRTLSSYSEFTSTSTW